MRDTLITIKRLIMSRRFVFTHKARIEMESDGLTEMDALEAIMTAVAINKTIRSKSPDRTSRNEKLYVIVGTNYEGLPIYTKGLIRRIEDRDVFYFLISSKKNRGD